MWVHLLKFIQVPGKKECFKLEKQPWWLEEMKIIIIFGPQMRGNPFQAKAYLRNFCKKDQRNHRNCVTRAPLLYFVWSWVRSPIFQSLSVRQACVTPFQTRSLKSTDTAHMCRGPKKVGGTKKLVDFFFIYSLWNSLAFFQLNVSEQSWNICNCEEKE